MLQPLSEIQLEKPLASPSALSDYKLPAESRKALNSLLNDSGYTFNTYTSYAITDTAKSGKPANFAMIPNQYFVFACKMYSFANELYKYLSIFDQLKNHSNELLGSAEKIRENIDNNVELKSTFEHENDILLFSQFMDQFDSTYRRESKRLINDDGVPRSAKDCFGSVILKEANIPDSSSSIFGRLVYDLCSNPRIYEQLNTAYENQANIASEIERVPPNVSLSKPFLLLAGISGTGKTRFVREQAKAAGNFDDGYCLTSVRPDWHEPSDLLGYISRLNGEPEYVTTDVLQFIARAWRAIFDAGLNVSKQAFLSQGSQLAVSGERENLNAVLPYWLCLDEMNLAPVEQYFADYLSVLETRSWQWDGDSFEYCSDALLKPSTIEQLPDSAKQLRAALGFDNVQYDDLWALIYKFGMGIPFNLLVAGTVNMDETTHGFSRKVLDRAQSFDFGEFFPNNFDELLAPVNQPKTLSYPVISHADVTELAETFDSDGQLSINFLNSVNQLLTGTPFKLAYRALNELLLAVICHNPKDEIALKAVWDDFLMCKVLPRIEGDFDKLNITNDTGNELSVLDALLTLLGTEFKAFWHEAGGDEVARPDLYRETIDGGNTITIGCRSKAKLEWMQARLDKASFTSFWP